MNTNIIGKKSLRSVLRVTALGVVLSFGAGIAHAADEPHSDGLVSTIADAAITTKVKAKLLSDSGLKKSDISVSTFNGVVTLSGSATTAAAKSKAEADAKAVSDVKSVDASALSVAGK